MNLRTGIRVGFGFWIILATLIALLVAGNALSAYSRNQRVDGLETINDKWVLVTTMKSALLEAAIDMRNIALQSDIRAMKKGGDRVRAQQQRYSDARNKFEAIGLSDAEKKIVSDITQLDKEIEAPLLEAMSQAFAFNNDTAAKILSITIDPLHQQELIEINKLVALQQVATQHILYDTLVDEKRWMIILFLTGAAALATISIQFKYNAKR
jgi:methyl-accepting chemotaxis protein